jgi:hypothetical protein
MAGRISTYLEDLYRRVKSVVPHACELFALRAFMRNTVTEKHCLRLRDFFEAIPDLQLPSQAVHGEILRAFNVQRDPNALTLDELAKLAARVPDYVDRYWLMVYALVAEAPEKVPQWRVRPFTRVLQTAFGIADTDMELAVGDALTFPATLPRP